MSTLLSIDIESFCKALEETGSKKVALIYHLRIEDPDCYHSWLEADISESGFNRLFRVKADPAAREGMFVDEIVIDEFSSPRKACDFITASAPTLKKACSECTILAIVPEPSITFLLVKTISWIVQLFKGVTDIGTPTSHWTAENIAVWPDEIQMSVARSQALDEPLFVYNLNKYKPIATYKRSDICGNNKNISGKEAYDRYSKIAGFELLRRGAYPVYGGTPICLFSNQENCMLADQWDHFIFVRYPERRNLLAMIESEEFHKGEFHREAGLERAAIFMTKNA